MRSLTATLLAVTTLAGPVVAQQGHEHDPDHAVAGGGNLPEGWSARLDNATASLLNVKFIPMGSGLHLTLGPAGIFYRQADKAEGSVHAVTKIQLFPSSGHAEGFGMFLGGTDLQGPEQAYTYFLIRGDGKFLIKQRRGASTSTVVAWTDSPAINPMKTSGPVSNELAFEVKGDTVNFMVNGKTVQSLPAHQIDTRGIIGIRANHNLNLHIDSFAVHKM
ncbi:MAG: hypothetical protein AB7Q69_01535 [Gemmatimonadales bacterium]